VKQYVVQHSTSGLKKKLVLQINQIVLLTAANTVKGMEGQKKSDILHHP